MRLTDEQRNAIVEDAARVFGPGAHLRLRDPAALPAARALLHDQDVDFCNDPYALANGADALVLATPNRLWPREVHHRVWLLHWLPRPTFEAALRFIGRYREPLWLLSWRTLGRLTSKEFAIQSWTEQVTRFPARYNMAVPNWIAACLAMTPAWIHRTVMPLSPTFVVTLRPGSPLATPGRKSSTNGEHSGSFGAGRTTDKAARSTIRQNCWPSLNSKQAEVHAFVK